ncbi:MAG: hypothetical protein E6J90_53440, partial [Deltaproteobacteria bacterium]
MIATAPGKLIVTGEYAVLDGATALVVAVDRRAVARRNAQPRGSSPFLVAVAAEIAARWGADHPAAGAALEISVDSSAFYDRASQRRLAVTPLGSSVAASAIDPGRPAGIGGGQKLGLGSSAAVTVAATALALESLDRRSAIDRDEILEVALAAHARAQGPRGARGSGADIAASVHGGTIAFSRPAAGPCQIERRTWPDSVTLVPFF